MRALYVHLSIAGLAIVSPLSAPRAANLKCMISAVRCIQTQGTEIPSKQVLTMLDSCTDFTNGDIGRVVLRISEKEMLDRTNSKVTPLSLAWFAFGELYDSPLRFERKKRAEETSYAEIKQSCLQLERDFNTDSKWTK